MRAFVDILQQYPKLTFEAFSLLVEYYLLQIAQNFSRAFKIIIINGFETNGTDFWLGKSNRVIKYHALDCPLHQKNAFAEKLEMWETNWRKPSRASVPSYWNRARATHKNILENF